MNGVRTSLELCAGAGGQALGLERAGFTHLALVEIDRHACATLRLNRSANWNVIEEDISNFSAHPFEGVDLVAAGVPCPPFSKAGRQLGKDDERDLFPQVLRIVSECRPAAVMIENVRGLFDAVFQDYRHEIGEELSSLGYEAQWRLLNAKDFGVPQLRPRTICVALRREAARFFEWPRATTPTPVTVGAALENEMARAGWKGARDWAANANRVAPTLVGGSKKHGGPDLGPTRARREWKALGVNASTLASEPPEQTFFGRPRLTVRMAAMIQGFPPDWQFSGAKTPAYRQVGNAFPPPVAEAIGKKVKRALELAAKTTAAQADEASTLPNEVLKGQPIAVKLFPETP